MSRADIQSAFEEVYFNRFRVRLPEIRAQIVNVNTSVTGRRPEVDLAGLIDNSARAGSVAAAQTSSRPVWFGADSGGSGWQDTPVYAREKLPLDAACPGRPFWNRWTQPFSLSPGTGRCRMMTATFL